ncbi:aspartate/glutamate racemase family protein [Mesobacterium pallidum]|uniref:aspartate/glutamate racemase family protein n=1 Tax=Mesobacterium pallidum TaxID=2872037 RepID=UPI001EE38C37|nr:aspartate/glutamate racemase family protein [Mesobacterium pallidum]
MRLLAINPNTSEEVTEAVVAELRRLAPEVQIDGVTGRFGARIVTTEAENLIACHAALDLAAEHAGGVDGVILAISFDSALRALSELLPVPVVGLTEASLTAATDPVGVVIFGASSQPLYARLLSGYGCTPAAWEVVDFATRADYLDAKARDAAVLEAVARLAVAGAGSVIILGAAVVGMAERIAPLAALPVHDGAAALALCLGRIAAGDTGQQKPRPIDGSIGLSPALAALIGGPA